MMQQYLKELEQVFVKTNLCIIFFHICFSQEPFDPEEFVERLAWRTIAETKRDESGDFNPILLHDSFVQAIKYVTY